MLKAGLYYRFLYAASERGSLSPPARGCSEDVPWRTVAVHVLLRKALQRSSRCCSKG